MKPNPYRFKNYPTLAQDQPISVKDLAREFSQNPTSASNYYAHKRMLIEGIVTYVGPDMFGLPSLELSHQVNGNHECLCVFNDNEDIADVQVGDPVTIRANFIDCVPDYGPTFKKCEIIG